MQEIKYSGAERLTDDVTPRQVTRAVANPRNRTVTVHKPGSVFVDARGEQMTVTEGGKIVPFINRAGKRTKRQSQRRARRKNRGR